MPQDVQVLGNGRGGKLQQFGDLTNAQLPAHQSHESTDPAFVRQGIGDGKHFAHRQLSISPDNEMYPQIASHVN